MPNCLRSPQIADGADENLLADPDHFRGDGAATDIKYTFQQRAALIDLAEHAVGIDLDIVEFNPRRVVRIDHRGALGLDTPGFRIDQK